MTVLASHSWPTNGHLIADVAKLGYIKSDDLVLRHWLDTRPS